MKDKTNNKRADIYDYDAIILAGGKSTRMGFPKPWLKNNDGSFFVEKLVNTYSNWGCNKIVVVINDAFCQAPWTSKIKLISKAADIVVNVQPEKERFYSLKLAAKHLVSSDFVFVHNVDNPFVSLELLELLNTNKIVNGYTTPTYNGKGGHPILVSGEIIRQIDKLEDHSLNLRDVIKRFERKNITVSWQQVLTNVNTKKKYDEYLKTSSINVCY